MIYAAAPFLQPYHGFPHHYYNMTDAGLRNLLGERFECEHGGTPAYGLPIWSLSWYLDGFARGLPDGTAAERFARSGYVTCSTRAELPVYAQFVDGLASETVVEARGRRLRGRDPSLADQRLVART